MKKIEAKKGRTKTDEAVRGSKKMKKQKEIEEILEHMEIWRMETGEKDDMKSDEG